MATIIKMFGVIYPDKITESNWSPELEAYVGKFVRADFILPSAFDEGWFIITESGYDEDPYWLPEGPLIHESCLVDVIGCGCDSFDMANGGCQCGGFQSEEAFLKAFRKIMEQQ